MTHLSLVARQTDVFSVHAHRMQMDEPQADFFASVSSRYARARVSRSASLNAPEKVLAEVGLFLTAVSIFVVAICALVPGP